VDQNIINDYRARAAAANDIMAATPDIVDTGLVGIALFAIRASPHFSKGHLIM